MLLQRNGITFLKDKKCRTKARQCELLHENKYRKRKSLDFADEETKMSTQDHLTRKLVIS